MIEVPFLRPRMVEHEAYAVHLAAMDKARQYTNFGPLNTRFEQRAVNEWMGGIGAAATVCNATLGLMLAIATMKRTGRYALMPSFTFAATPLAAQWCGLEPLFVDVDPDEWVADNAQVREILAAHGDDIAVVVPYATCGTHMDLAPYESMMRQGVPVVVDAAPCFGTSRDGVQFGQGFSGAIVFSFHATKAFPVGEGGMVYSADTDLIRRIKLSANYCFDGGRESTGLGLNAKLSEIGAAVALATLDCFADTVARRQAVYARYLKRLSASGLLDAGYRVQRVKGEAAYQWLPLLTPDVASQQRLMSTAATLGIELRRYFVPPCHEHRQFASAMRGPMTVTEQLGARVVSLPLWDEMTDAIVDRVVEAVAESARDGTGRLAAHAPSSAPAPTGLDVPTR